MKTGIRDVAQHAGVSIATVSHVLNNTKNVKPETRERVLNSISILGYIPDSTARSFKSGRRRLVGCIVPDLSNCFWSKTIESIEQTLSLSNYHLIITNTKEAAEKELEDIEILSSGVVDGLILGSTLEDSSLISEVLPSAFPIIFIDRIPKNCPYCSITISNYTSVYNGVSELVRRGHIKIGFISGLEHLSTSRERFTAYKDALIKSGIQPTDDMIRAGNSMSLSALEPSLELIANGCTALVISNNVMASDVQSFLYREKPEYASKIEILGYCEGENDICMARPFGLISQPSQQMGQLAAQQITALIDSPKAALKSYELSSTLTLYTKER